MVAVTMLGLVSCIAHAIDVAPGVQLHGYMQNRIYSAPAANPEFRSERISVSATAALPNESNAYVEVYYHPWASSSGLYLESAYYDTKLGTGNIRVGKGRRLTFGITPAYPNRRTSNYGIVSEAFTQDRIQGAQYYVSRENLDFGISAQTAYRLGTRAVGEIPGDTVRNAGHQVPQLAFRDIPGDLSNKAQVSARVGGRWESGLKAGVSVSFNTLDARDLTNLTTSSSGNPLTPGATPALLVPTADDDVLTWGLDATFKKSNLVAQAEYYSSDISELNMTGWNVLLGWEPPAGWRFYARYGDKTMDDVIKSTNPLSWDIRQISLSAVQPIRKGLWLQYEYEINGEDPAGGADSVRNNLFFVELYTGF